MRPLATGNNAQVEIVSFFRWTSFDSTPIRMSVASELKHPDERSPEALCDAGDRQDPAMAVVKKVHEPSVCKILQTECLIGVLLKIKGPEEKHVLIKSPLSCPLQVANSQAAESLD